MSQSEYMHLAADCSMLHTDYTWQYPDSWPNKAGYYKPEWWENLARSAEAGMFDMLFFGDSAETSENYGGDFRAILEDGVRWPKPDRAPIVAMMARATEKLGFGMTMSTTYHHPYYVARYFASLDHATDGRIAWNAVTSGYKNEAANYGLPELAPPEIRYERAQEHIEVVKKLWDSVEPDALVFDRETGQFADPDKVHFINHVGKYFDVKGPMPMLPSAQGRPPVITAGQSEAGMELAATEADMQFVLRRSIGSMARHREDLDRRLLAHGRSIRDVGVWWCVRTQLGSSPSDADARARSVIDALPPRAGLVVLSCLFGVDFAAFDPRLKLSEFADQVKSQKGHWGMFEDILANSDPDMTLEQYGKHYLYSPDDTFRGTGEQIADKLEELWDATGRNGGVILRNSFVSARGMIDDFISDVVPALQRRGLVRSERVGTTMRENVLD